MKNIVMEYKILGKKVKIYKVQVYISDLAESINPASRAVRGHWGIESMHWHLDVTFCEDYSTTADKNSHLEL